MSRSPHTDRLTRAIERRILDRLPRKLRRIVSALRAARRTCALDRPT